MLRITAQQQYLNDAKQRYQERCLKLVGKYPNLRNEDYKRWCPYPNPDSSRVACIQFSAHFPHAPVTVNRFNDADSLSTFLAEEPRPTDRRLFILESFNDKIRDLVSLKLDVDPQVFHRHTRVAIWESARTNAGNTPLLPSLIDSGRSWAMLYSQLIHLNLEKQEFTHRCLGSERHIASSRYDGKLDGVGSISCKISFSGTRRGQLGWDGM
ncbi:hypothetical protein GJ744_008166 [Endocarpon pusillum]|uniref:Uncharacterized protein n=1 Tax=Endocarpon pusillum TaxID=364733 RepID=A0A8H7ALS2_9EURO|nr:hypothetical protein GJ744_008166 [Endocarpon pusillum]